MIYLMWILKKILVNESDISRFINNTDLDEKIKKMATKEELKVDQDKTVKMQTHILCIFLAKYFVLIIVFKVCLFITWHLLQ